jgi:hypothetical protein
MQRLLSFSSVLLNRSQAEKKKFILRTPRRTT